MDQFYFEEGYIETGYFAVIREADAQFASTATFTVDVEIADTTGYYIPDYIAEGYYVGGVVQEGEAVLSSSFVQTAQPTRIRELEADFDTLFSPSIVINATRGGETGLFTATAFAVTESRIRSNDAALNNIVNLSLQSSVLRSADSLLQTIADTDISVARIRSSEYTAAASFDQSVNATRIKQLSADFDTLFTPNITPVASLNGSIDLHTQATLLAVAGDVIKVTKTLSTETALTVETGFLRTANSDFVTATEQSVSAIKYQERIPNFGRPINLDASTNGILRSSAQSKFGSDSLFFQDATEFAQTESLSTLLVGNNVFVIEGWVYLGNLRATTSLTNIVLIDDQIQIRLESDSTYGQIEVNYRRFDQWNLLDRHFIEFAEQDNWHHIAVRYDGSKIEFRWNNSVVGSVVTSVATNKPTSFVQFSGTDVYDNLYFDGWTFRIGSAQITGYTAQPENDNTTTRGLWLMEDTATQQITDDVIPGVTFEANAALNTVSNITANAGIVASAEINLETTVTETVVIGTVESSAAQLDINSTVDITAIRIRSSTVDLEANSALTTLVDRTRSTEVDYTSEFTVVTAASAVRSFDADFEAFNTQIAVVSKIGDFFVNADLVSTIQADVNVITDQELTLNATFSQIAIFDAIRRAVWAQNARFDQNAVSIRIAGTDADFVSQTAITAKTGFLASANTNLNSHFSLAVDGVLESEAEADFNTNMLLSVLSTRIKQFTADFNTVSTITAEPSKTVEVSQNLQSEFSTTVAATKIKQLNVDLSAFNTQLTAAAKIADFGAEFTVLSDITVIAEKDTELVQQFNTAFAISTDPDRIRSSAGDLQVNSDITANAIKAVEATAELSSQGSFEITVLATKVGETDLQTTAEIETVANFIADNSSELEAQHSLTVEATVNSTGIANFTANTVLSAAVGITADAGADLNTNFTQLVLSRIIVVDAFVYTIPRENRKQTITNENNTIIVNNENRSYTIQGAD